MLGKRVHTRSLCFDRCLLVGSDGINHDVVIENISDGGALLKTLEGGIPKSLKVNRDFSYLLHRKPELNLSRYSCTIVWMEEVNFGVEFLHNYL